MRRAPSDAQRLGGRSAKSGPRLGADVVIVQSPDRRPRQNRLMPSQLRRRRPLAFMWTPAARWSEHLRMFVVRDTRGCDLDGPARLNRFPANPYCCITWLLQGQAELIAQGDSPCGRMLPQTFVAGCQTRPTVSRNLGDRLSFSAVFYPDAFHSLFGVDLAALQDAFVDASQILPAHGLQLLADVAAAPDDLQRRRIVEDFLQVHSSSLGSSPWMRLRRMGANVGLKVAARVLGVGPRQVQRLARREGGLNVPDMSRLWRSERSLKKVRETLARDQGVDWASHALEAGYADQSHLVRECKQFSGRTPGQILQQARQDEADWIYRL
jgi:AraC-like DNA-binding protein